MPSNNKIINSGNVLNPGKSRPCSLLAKSPGTKTNSNQLKSVLDVLPVQITTLITDFNTTLICGIAIGSLNFPNRECKRQSTA